MSRMITTTVLAAAACCFGIRLGAAVRHADRHGLAHARLLALPWPRLQRQPCAHVRLRRGVRRDLPPAEPGPGVQPERPQQRHSGGCEDVQAEHRVRIESSISDVYAQEFVTTDDQGRAAYLIRRRESFRLWATVDDAGCAQLPRTRHDIVIQEDRVGTMVAHRNGARDYSFSGFYAGPSKIMTLYRVQDGKHDITAQTRVQGEFYSFRRTFLRSGAWPMYVKTGTEVYKSLGKKSPERFTVVH